MITDKDLIGTWKISETHLKNKSVDAQNLIDYINSKYSIIYKENNTYLESNNGIVIGRMSNFSGDYSIEGDKLLMSIKSFAFKRTYIIEANNIDKYEIKFYPCDTLYCNIYSNIDYLLLKKYK